MDTFEGIQSFPASYSYLENNITSHAVVVIDKSHGNALQDLVLVEGILRTGATVEFLEQKENLSIALRNANAFVVTSPQESYTEEELFIIQEFVKKKGKLFLATDEYEGTVNSLAKEFGIYYRDDYLFNLKKNEGNFKYVYVDSFVQNGITKDLHTIVLYSTCSLETSHGVAMTDADTKSTFKEGQFFSVISASDSILAMCDKTFLKEPYNHVQDNAKLISNIVEWLVTQERIFNLVDYPAFFSNNVNIVPSSELQAQALELRYALEKTGRKVKLSGEMIQGMDNLLVLNYKDKKNVEQYLAHLNITSTHVRAFGLSFDQKDATFVYLSPGNESVNVFIFVPSSEVLQKSIAVLDSARLRQYLINSLAAYITVQEETGEEKKEEKG